jgi:hypothetical protein
MKKSLFILCTLALSGCAERTSILEEKEILHSEKVSRSTEVISFDFPDIQWAALDTHEQKVAACEIPDSILSDIPTEELVGICMKYPLILDAYAFNSPLLGIKKVLFRFNGFKELMKRADNCFYIFKYLKENDVRDVNFASLTYVEEGRGLLVYSLGEYMLSFENILKNADGNLKKEIISFAYDILSNKESDSKHYALNGLASSLHLWASALSNDKMQARNTDAIIDNFLETGVILSQEEYLKIKQHYQTYN